MPANKIVLKTLLIAAFLVSCHSQNKLSKRELRAFYISMEKTPCFGSCPMYTITVDSKAMVELDARRFMDKLGKTSVTLSDVDLKSLQSVCAKASWDTYQAQYLTGNSDLPSTIVRYSIKQGDTLGVRYEANLAPTELISIASKLQKIQENIQKEATKK
jgi:hypothetical protein